VTIPADVHIREQAIKLFENGRSIPDIRQLERLHFQPPTSGLQTQRQHTGGTVSSYTKSCLSVNTLTRQYNVFVPSW
jgi:hypothetical protein